jgi:small subunit ribosomal protein S8
MPTSKLKVEIARLLLDEGYVEAFAVARGEESFDVLTVTLKYADDRRRVIQGIKRISKPGRRIYAKSDRLPKVLGGLGTAIMSTPVGVITSRQAAERGIGGEVLCFVW